MRAWRIDRAGDAADVYRLDEVDSPAPGHGQVRVKVLAAAVNYPDVMMARGQYQVQPPYPYTPGVELCGEVSGRTRGGCDGAMWCCRERGCEARGGRETEASHLP